MTIERCTDALTRARCIGRTSSFAAAFVACAIVLVAVTARRADAQAPAVQARAAHGEIDSVRLQFRSISAVRIDGPRPHIDGRLDEPLWQRLLSDPHTAVTDFVESSPRPGSIPPLRTIAAFAYDDDAMYVAVRAFDPHPDSIVAPYPRRDYETRSDWIFVEIDTRHDRRSAWSLGVNPRGVQVDGSWSFDVDYDYTWNAVWESAAHVDSLGWTVEYRIPFSQLRAAPTEPGTRIATWGLNVYRYVARRGESYNWSPRLPTYAGIVSHFNDLTNIEIASSGHAVELRPFTLVRSEPRAVLAPSTIGSTRMARDQSASIGADATVRLGAGLTLDAALRPDFGQVEADPSQINLTTFETFLTEQRPFFTNAADVFTFPLGLSYSTRGDDFSADQAFYSRRIGAAPHGSAPSWALASDIPAASTLDAAAKISGRTSTGWTLGALVARTAEERARFLDTLGTVRDGAVEPPTTFAAGRVARELGNGATTVGAFATFVERAPSTASLDALLPHRALFLGTDARHRFDDAKYEISTLAGVSDVTGSAAAIDYVLSGPGHYLQRPGLNLLDGTATDARGAIGRATFARVGGSELTWSVTGLGISPRFDANEGGFQRNADWLLAVGTVNFEHRPSGGPFRRWSVGSNQIGTGWSTHGERRSAIVNANTSADLWSYWHGALSVDQELRDVSTELLRGGPAVVMPPRTMVMIDVTTDSRRATRLDVQTHLMREHGTGSSQLAVTPTLTSRVTDRLALTGGVELASATNGWQYLTRIDDASGPRYALARLRQRTASLTMRVDYAFSPTLTLQGYAQPYLGAGRFDRLAVANGVTRYTTITPTPATIAGDTWLVDTNGDGATDATIPRPDFGVRQLHGSAVLRWEYRPGSELYLVWTQTRDGESTLGTLALQRDATALFRVAPRNVLLAKATYHWEP